jgi:hypothetical protein
MTDVLVGSGALLAGFVLERTANPLWVPAAIEHSMDNRLISGNPVVDGIREALREMTMIAELDAMYAGVEN